MQGNCNTRTLSGEARFVELRRDKKGNPVKVVSWYDVRHSELCRRNSKPGAIFSSTRLVDLMFANTMGKPQVALVTLACADSKASSCTIADFRLTSDSIQPYFERGLGVVERDYRSHEWLKNLVPRQQ